MKLILGLTFLLGCSYFVVEGVEIAPYISNAKPVESIDNYASVVVFSSLFSMEPVEPICGGVILAPHWILTAARCTNLGNIKSIYVSYGILELQDRYKRLAVLDRVVVHPQYNRTNLANDLALFHTEKPLPVGTVVKQAKLFEGTLNENDILETAGWGQSRLNDALSPVLQSKNLTVIDHQTCTEELPHDRIDAAQQFCTYGTRGGGSPCKGDVGNPVFILPSRELVGILSFGGRCDEFKPAVSTNLKEYLPWIKEVIVS